jgi:uncharacterized membrane protein YphA (DoxX/SURF4 family)
MLERIPLLFLLPLRLCCGYLLWAGGLAKVLSGWLHNPLLAVQVNGWLAEKQPPLLLLPLLHHLLHHAQLYSTTLAAAELGCGAALAVGLFSRYAALGGLLVTGLPIVAAGDWLGPNPQLAVGAGLLALGMCSSGRSIGLDALLRGRVPAWLS